MNFPLIYCNGDSYSDENYNPALVGNTYVNWISRKLNGFVLNKAIRGSNNRRIIRTTVHDIIHQRKLNPTQQIIVIIGLSFELRAELWDDEQNSGIEEESQFITHQFSEQLNWYENLLANKSINTPTIGNKDIKFFKKFSEGRAFFYSPYAERINLLCDLIMLRSLLESLDIQFLIFQSPKAEKLESEYLLDFFKKQIEIDKRFFDLEEFGFVDWCHDNGFLPIDFVDRPEIGHYNVNAHKAFAEEVLFPRLKETGQV